MSGNKKYIIAVFIAIAALVVYVVLSKKGSNQSAQIVPTETPTGTIVQKEGGNKSMNQLKIEDLVVGTGAEAVNGKKVTVNYLGTLTNGKKFDSSYDHGTPFAFNLGAGQVIKGWDMGVVGMKIGGKRRLTIPSDLGYGDRGAGSDILPGATLIFEVELLKVE